MAAKLILSTVAATALMGASAFAQVQTTETDPRFMPRTYGSTAVTGVNYGHGTAAQASTIAAPTQPVITYDYGAATNTVRVVEPVTQDVQTIISAPVTYTDTGVVKAQHFKQGDLSTEEYNALLAEADRIRAYQVNSQQYSYDNAQAFNPPAPGVSESYEIELFEPEAVALEDTIIYAETTPITTFSEPAATTAHTVTKGDTLYNISKRYAVTVDALQTANGLYGNTIGLGQVLTIPSSTTIISENTYVAPLTLASTSTPAPVTLVRNVEPIPGQSSGIYAVLPKDTLYSISRRACVKVADLISTNGISNPNALQPGQRLTMPAGHCLN